MLCECGNNTKSCHCPDFCSCECNVTASALRRNPDCCSACSVGEPCCGLKRNPGGISRGYASAKNWGGPLFRKRNPGGISRGYASAKNWGGPLFRNNPENTCVAAGCQKPGTETLAGQGYLCNEHALQYDRSIRANPGGISRGYASAKNWGGPLFRNPGGISRGYASAKNWGGPLFRNPSHSCSHCGGKGLVFDGVCEMCAGDGLVKNPGGISRGYASAKNWGGPLFRKRNPGGISRGYASAKNWGGPLFRKRNPGGISRGYASAKNWGGPLFRNPGGISRGYASAKNWGGPLFRNPESNCGSNVEDKLVPAKRNPGGISRGYASAVRSNLARQATFPFVANDGAPVACLACGEILRDGTQVVDLCGETFCDLSCAGDKEIGPVGEGQ